MKKLFLLPIALILATNVYAASVNLKNGSTVNGNIISQDAKKVKIEVDGAPMTYYMDEISAIDGVSVGGAVAEAPKKVVAAPVVTKPTTPAPTQSSGAIDSNKRALILKFIDVFGTKEAMTQNLQAMTESLPDDNPDYQKIKKGINVDEIIDRLVPVYAKYFTEEDLNDYIAFYSSPKGKKLIDAIAKVMRESVDVSAEYFQEKFPETANSAE